MFKRLVLGLFLLATLIVINADSARAADDHFGINYDPNIFSDIDIDVFNNDTLAANGEYSVPAVSEMYDLEDFQEYGPHNNCGVWVPAKVLLANDPKLTPFIVSFVGTTSGQAPSGIPLALNLNSVVGATCRVEILDSDASTHLLGGFNYTLDPVTGLLTSVTNQYTGQFYGVDIYGNAFIYIWGLGLVPTTIPDGCWLDSSTFSDGEDIGNGYYRYSKVLYIKAINKVPVGGQGSSSYVGSYAGISFSHLGFPGYPVHDAVLVNVTEDKDDIDGDGTPDGDGTWDEWDLYPNNASSVVTIHQVAEPASDGILEIYFSFEDVDDTTAEVTIQYLKIDDPTALWQTITVDQMTVDGIFLNPDPTLPVSLEKSKTIGVNWDARSALGNYGGDIKIRVYTSDYRTDYQFGAPVWASSACAETTLDLSLKVLRIDFEPNLSIVPPSSSVDGVANNSSITITFSNAMNTTTTDQVTIGGSDIPEGTWAWVPNSNTVIKWTPNNNDNDDNDNDGDTFALNAAYTISFNSTCIDLWGNSISAGTSYEFTTTSSPYVCYGKNGESENHYYYRNTGNIGEPHNILLGPGNIIGAGSSASFVPDINAPSQMIYAGYYMTSLVNNVDNLIKSFSLLPTNSAPITGTPIEMGLGKLQGDADGNINIVFDSAVQTDPIYRVCRDFVYNSASIHHIAVYTHISSAAECILLSDGSIVEETIDQLSTTPNTTISAQNVHYGYYGSSNLKYTFSFSSQTLDDSTPLYMGLGWIKGLAGGDLEFIIDPSITPAPVAPTITDNPTNVIVREGQPASFSVVATGTAPLIYKWQKSMDRGTTWTDIIAAASNNYTTAPISKATDIGTQYRAIVINSGGSVTSTAANLIIETKIIASDCNTDDHFGCSVDIDGNRIVIGAEIGTGLATDDVNDYYYINAGCVYAYVWNSDYLNWNEQKMFVIIDMPSGNRVYHSMPYDHFGCSVAMDGDKTIVGAVGVNDLADEVGSAFICDGNDIDEQIFASDGADRNRFGESVAIGGSGERIIVGSIADYGDVSTPGGCIYVYDEQTSTNNKINAHNGTTSDCFGCSVAIDGDRIVVGAEGSDKVYVYDWNTIMTTESCTDIIATDGSGSDFFGCSIAIDGDRIVVGALGNGYNGACYVYDWNSSTSKWDETKLTPLDSTANAQFGSSVAIDGDRIVVGAPMEYAGTEANVGSVYVYDYNGTTWVETKIMATDCADHSNFGSCVAIDNNRIVVGAPGDDENGTDSGSVYIYE